MSKIKLSYRVVYAKRIHRRQPQPLHVVRCQAWPPLSLPVADEKALCGVVAARRFEGGDRKDPSAATCPEYRRKYRRVSGQSEKEQETGNG